MRSSCQGPFGLRLGFLDASRIAKRGGTQRTQGGIIWIPVRRVPERLDRGLRVVAVATAGEFREVHCTEAAIQPRVIGVELDGRLERLFGLCEIVAGGPPPSRLPACKIGLGQFFSRIRA